MSYDPINQSYQEHTYAVSNPTTGNEQFEFQVYEKQHTMEPATANPYPASSHSEEDTLALLPRNTVVKILGNNRTKIALIGQTAVVKRAVGLGGWHWLTLNTGEEIKLQRNALSVVEFPSGQEHLHDTSASDDDEQHHHPHSPYHRRSPQPHHYKPAPVYRETATAAAVKRPSRPVVPFTAEEYNGQRRVVGVQRYTPYGASASTVSPTKINFGKLNDGTLRRYNNFYQLQDVNQPTTNTPTTRDDLVSTISQHFSNQEIDEGVVIAHFLAAARRHAMGLPRA